MGSMNPYTFNFCIKVEKISMSKFICCPKCNYQYLPGEIFEPRYFLGQPKHIIRNGMGEILGYEGIVMDPTETFVCENCGEEFIVNARLSITVKTNNEPTTVEKIEDNSLKQVNLF